MARTPGKATVMLLDVAEPMHDWFETALTAISGSLVAKMVNSPKEQASLVLYGTTDTDNSVHREVGDSEQYLRITELWPMKCPCKEEVALIESLAKGYGKRDAEVLEALVVAINLLKSSHAAGTANHQHEVVVVSNFLGESAPPDGALVDAVVEQLQGMRVSLRTVFLKQDAACRIPEALDQVMQGIGSLSTLTTISSRPELLVDAFRSKEVAPTTTLRGALTIGSQLSIPVYVFKKTSKVRPPSLKPYSDRLPDDAPAPATHEVRVDREYKNKNDAEVILGPEDLVKGLQYGSQVVPMDSATEQHLKFYASEKGLRVIGFVSRDNTPRDHFLEETSVVMPEPKNEKASVAMSAFVQAMAKQGKVAIARAVWRERSPRVALGVLTPYPGTSSRADGMLFNELPYAEDYRMFKFESFGADEKHKPKAEQGEAMRTIVKGMQLDANRDLRPEMTGDPSVAWFYQHVAAVMGHTSTRKQAKALETRLTKRAFSDEDAVVNAGKVLRGFLEQAKAAAGSAGESGLAAEGGTGASGDAARGTNDPGAVPPQEAPTSGVFQLGSSTTAEDFSEMMQYPDRRGEAMAQMKDMIMKLVRESIGNRFYDKAVNLLGTMRRKCVDLGADHANQFNEYFAQLKRMCQERAAYGAFWKLVVDSSIDFVTSAEVPGCTAVSEDAESTLPLQEEQQETKQSAPHDTSHAGPGPGAATSDNDDEFDDMD